MIRALPTKKTWVMLHTLSTTLNRPNGVSHNNFVVSTLVPGKFLGIVSQDPSDSKSNWLHVDIFWFCFYSFEVYLIDSFRMMSRSLKVSNFNWLLLKVNRFIYN